MARIVKRTAHGPKIVDGKAFCMCGLSKNQPFCDGSHMKTMDEDETKTYTYDEDGKREEACICTQDCTCSCCKK